MMEDKLAIASAFTSVPVLSFRTYVKWLDKERVISVL